MLQKNPQPETSDNRRVHRVGPRGLALIIASALFMEQLDSTILATALPDISRSFHVDAVSLNIAITSYVLALAVFIPASGQVADRLGARAVFRAAIAIFTISSVLCGLSTNVWMLASFRVLQGLGGAMMVPVGRLVLFRSITKSELIVANSWLLVPAMLGPVIGPPLGGAIVTYVDWRWIFWVNVPIGIGGFILVTFLVAETRPPEPKPFDILGLFLTGAGLSLLLSGLETATQHRGSQTVATAAIATGLALLAAYVVHARRLDNPVLNLRLLRLSTFRASVVGGTLFRCGFGALPFLLPLLFQLGFGVSAAKSGAITFMSAAGSMVMKSMTVTILRRFGYRNVMIWNASICSSFLLLYGFFRPSWPLVAIYVTLFVGGLFRSLQFNAFGSICYADVTADEMSAATSFNITMQQTSITFGIAIAAVVLHLASAAAGRTTPSLHDFTIAFAIVAALSMLSLPLSLALRRDAGFELTGRKQA